MPVDVEVLQQFQKKLLHWTMTVVKCEIFVACDKSNAFLIDYDPFYDSDVGTNLLSEIVTSSGSESECKFISYTKVKVLLASKLQIHRLKKLNVVGRLEALPSLVVR